LIVVGCRKRDGFLCGQVALLHLLRRPIDSRYQELLSGTLTTVDSVHVPWRIDATAREQRKQARKQGAVR
jgi:hypothetical protein